MQPVISKYLALYKKLDIPGIGNFRVDITPASLQFADKQLEPPASRILFSPSVRPINNHFYGFLSREWKVEKVVAIRRYKEVVEEVTEELKQTGVCELEGIGTLRKATDGSIDFALAASSLSFFPPLPAERVLRKYAQHTVLVGEREHIKDYVKPDAVSEATLAEEEPPADRWKLYALILAIIAVLMIMVYYVFR